ncbi:MAG: hypothetical protein OXE99_14590, partial [Cellvibrionales bacterium]|nr:hypothetical protein [Cellvibrionales bacterium]
ELVECVANSPDTLIYYPTKDADKEEVYYRGMFCTQQDCKLNDYQQSNVKGLENATKIKLAFKYNPGSMSTTDMLSADVVALSGLTLNKTGEWFGNAEISVSVQFFNNNVFLQEHRVRLPWAVKKGLNVNRENLPFFTWPEDANKAVASILQLDSDTRMFKTLRMLAGIAKKFGRIGEIIGDVADTVIDCIHEKIMENDYIGTAIFVRGKVPTNLATEEGTAVFHIQ